MGVKQPFDPQDITRGKELFEKDQRGHLFFSEGTYQVEVPTDKGKEWPFLQFTPKGELVDYFCSCSSFENKRSCPHLSAAFFRIYNREKQPLHQRFHKSFWYILTDFYSAKIGYEPDLFQHEEEKYLLYSRKGRRIFQIDPLNPEGEKRLHEIFFQREEEKEENSIKFSNLPEEELVLWREKKPSHALRYELSFWSDLAKWWIELQEKGKIPTISFGEQKGELPHRVEVRFADVAFIAYLPQALLELLIPTLASVPSPLRLFSYDYVTIREIGYHKKQLRITYTEEVADQDALQSAIPVDSWLYIPTVGFLTQRYDRNSKKEIIKDEEIARFLSRYAAKLREKFVDTNIDTKEVSARYHLFFDGDKRLHLCPYLYKQGDLQQNNAALFHNWAYLPDRGFVPVTNLLFPEVETVITLEKLTEFLQKHRLWLSEQEGFELNLSPLRKSVDFTLDEKGLHLIPKLGPDEEVSILDLDQWLYLEGVGFYPKKGGGFEVMQEQTIDKERIPAFINLHQEQLETIKGFFSSQSPIKEIGLDITLDTNDRIVIEPKIVYLPAYQTREILQFGEYTYVPSEGFSRFPSKFATLPYKSTKTIPRREELKFLDEELPRMRSFVLHIDPRLESADDLTLEIKRLKREQKGGWWIAELVFSSRRGKVPVYQIWEALQERKSHLFSEAGCIHLKGNRFAWWKTIGKKRWREKGLLLRLLPIEWLRLTLSEEIRTPLSDDRTARKTRRLLEEFSSMQSEAPIDLSGLRSVLRSYQQNGLKWLWFLYQNRLSGFLCDEMGLGKTHQAMALIAAAFNASIDETPQFLVVCPTSVIYHWQGLLRRFFPTLPVTVFYGPVRRLDKFTAQKGLLLTSYGVMRSDRKRLSEISFDIAVYDEIHMAKNPKSQTNRALREIDALVRIGLTGTPVENRLTELKALFDIVVPSFLPSDAVFREEFLLPIEQHASREKQDLLSKLIKPFILRRSKKEVLVELPEKTEEISYCDLTPTQKQLYNEIYTQTQQELLPKLRSSDKEVPYVHIFSILSKLKQVCDHPSLITGESSDPTHSGKWELFIELLRESRGSGLKVVVFSQYLKMLDIIENYLKAENIGYATIRGSTRNREEQLSRFANDPSCEVFVASLQAAGVGIDLVAASVVIHYDRWWNPAREDQATDRVHRIGQSRGVQVFKLVTKGTIEEHIHYLIEKKKHLLEHIVGYDDKEQVKLFDREELIQLLSLAEPP